MKILLIYPYPLYDRSNEEDIRPVPIGLYWIGAMLKSHDYDVEILNWYNIHKTPEKIVETLLEKRPAIIGFSILNANRWGGIEIARIARQVLPKVQIVFGGVASTFLWKHFLTHFPEIDFIVLGEGEYSFLKLVQAVEAGRPDDAKDIDGIALRKGSKIVKTCSPKPIADLDRLPVPARYFTYEHVISSRGCPGRCTFCGSPALWNRRVRFRSPDHFVTELDLLHQKGISFFYFSDDTFTLGKERVIDICKEILKRGLTITWAAISRVDRIDEETLLWMRKAGCVQISYGVESGSEKIRALLNKQLKTESILRAFDLTRRCGILPRAYFIYGSPDETGETIEESVKLIRAIRPLAFISYILEIYPGTALYEDYKRRFNATDDVWLRPTEGICYFETDPRLSKDMVLEFGRTLRREFHRSLHAFVDDLDLVQDDALYPYHADFCSRLALTFSHGDYSQNPEIENSRAIAEGLFRKALGYGPDHRAYLGLGILKQREGRFREAAEVLEQGIKYFPESKELNVCLAVSHMNLGDYREGLSRLIRFQGAPEVNDYIAVCHEALGEFEEA